MSAAAVLDALKQLSHDMRGAIGTLAKSETMQPAARHLRCRLTTGRILCCLRWLTAAACAALPCSADLDVGSSVDRHYQLPVVQFLREYVAANKPVVLTGEDEGCGRGEVSRFALHQPPCCCCFCCAPLQHCLSACLLPWPRRRDTPLASPD